MYGLDVSSWLVVTVRGGRHRPTTRFEFPTSAVDGSPTESFMSAQHVIGPDEAILW